MGYKGRCLEELQMGRRWLYKLGGRNQSGDSRVGVKWKLESDHWQDYICIFIGLVGKDSEESNSGCLEVSK